MAEDDKEKLYKQIMDQADPYLLLDRMQELGFWPWDEPLPEEPKELREERARLQDELRRLRKKGVTVGDPDKALAQERVRRWEESKKRRKLRKLELEAQRKKRREQWDAHRASTVVHAGDGVSAGLAGDDTRFDLLEAAGLPKVHTSAELAEAMGLTLPQLRWLTFHRRSVTLVHYHRYDISKKTGGRRHISAPKPLLKRAQRWVLEAILERVPPTDDAHGFVRGRSTVTNALPHVGKRVVVNLDLRDFFPTLGFRRVKGLFRKLGYGEHVATTLALLTTEPPRVLAELDGVAYFVALGDRVLPQGACTSPAITNLVCRRLDRRLRGLATKNGWIYTRYADDLTLSGDDPTRLTRILHVVRQCVREEGFVLHDDKTRVMRKGSRQEVTGLVVNDRLGLSKKERRRLRAKLHEARTKGLEAANRDNHPRFREYLRGMVAYVSMVDPEHAARFRRDLDALF